MLSARALASLTAVLLPPLPPSPDMPGPEPLESPSLMLANSKPNLLEVEVELVEDVGPEDGAGSRTAGRTGMPSTVRVVLVVGIVVARHVPLSHTPSALVWNASESSWVACVCSIDIDG
jgi:hypothetical protein